MPEQSFDLVILGGGSGGYGFTGKGPTGVAVRALLRLAEDFSAAV